MLRRTLASPRIASLPTVAVGLGILFASRSARWAPEGLFPRPEEMLGWCLLGALAALHRPLGGRTLGLGALVLVPACERLGAVPAAIVAAVAVLSAGAVRHLARRRITGAARRADGVGLDAEHAVWLAGATLAAGTLVSFRPETAGDVSGLAARALLPAALYVLVAASLGLAAWRLERPERAAPATVASGLVPLGLDAAGWWAGALVSDAAAVLGWHRAWPLAVVLALLAAEAARNAILRGASDHRVDDLERIQKGQTRILTETSGMGAIAEQILVECCNVMPVGWFQLEVASADERSEGGSWAAGPDGLLSPGVPRPEQRPGMLPGVHRRTGWHILEHPLVVRQETLAVLRLWCDPRRIESGAEELLASLVPHMASSVHRARLDREARLDPLTGVPVRRILDSSLQAAYRRCCEEGRAMAVIMCDIDFFKRVNDTHGHAAGDEALILVAQTLEEQRREHDLCCRYGGEEFTVLLEDTAGEAALQLAERLRQAIEALRLVYEGRPIPLTLSAGVAAFPDLHIKTASELLLLADEALYEAKERGRNRCLLNQGRGVYRAASGTTLLPEEPPERKPPPRIFG